MSLPCIRFTIRPRLNVSEETSISIVSAHRLEEGTVDDQFLKKTSTHSIAPIKQAFYCLSG